MGVLLEVLGDACSRAAHRERSFITISQIGGESCSLCGGGPLPGWQLQPLPRITLEQQRLLNGSAASNFWAQLLPSSF